MAEKVYINLDKPREVKLTLNAMLQFHEETGIDLQDPADLEKIKLKEMRYMLWLCLREEDPKTLWQKVRRFLGVDKPLTVEDVGALVHSHNMQEIMDSLNNARETATTDVKKN